MVLSSTGFPVARCFTAVLFLLTLSGSSLKSFPAASVSAATPPSSQIIGGSSISRRTVDYSQTPVATLHDWLSELNGNIHVPEKGVYPCVQTRGISRDKVLDELERRFKNEGKAYLTTEEFDELAHTDPAKFLSVEQAEISKAKNRKRNFTSTAELDNAGKSVVNATLRDSRNAIDEEDDMGFGHDWKLYQNAEGYTHLEELRIYQPTHWQRLAREHLFLFEGDLDLSVCPERDTSKRTCLCTPDGCREILIQLSTPVSVVLFHPEIPRTKRYRPLNFLLAYGVNNPLPKLLRDLNITQADKDALLADLSPLDYFFDFQASVESYKLDMLRSIAKKTIFPRLPLITEIDFCHIIGQRTAKQIIREELVRHIWDRVPEPRERGRVIKQQPLSLIFAGPSGNGKTEMAVWLAKLMNKPTADGKPDKNAFLKVDCGKLSDENEIFGMSGAYVGSTQGSALNNFIVGKSKDPQSLGIVLLDEIEKADKGVIHALYRKNVLQRNLLHCLGCVCLLLLPNIFLWLSNLFQRSLIKENGPTNDLKMERVLKPRSFPVVT